MDTPKGMLKECIVNIDIKQVYNCIMVIPVSAV